MPAPLVDAHGVTVHHGDRAILNAVDLRVDRATRLGLIGPNGAGKSTLLRVLAGHQRPDRGTVRRLGTVGHLAQLAGAQDRGTVREVVLERIGVAAASRALDRQAAALAAGDLAAMEPHAAALERWLALGGDDAEARLAAAADELGLAPELLDRPLTTLSGGQAARAGLAALRTARFDVLMLDEPTNHLDADGLERLGALLAERAGGLVLVSHDRAVLAEQTNRLLELDPHTGTATAYAGGWEGYERERDSARRRAREAHAHAVAERRRLAGAERETRRRAAATLTRLDRRPRDGDKFAREWFGARADGVAHRARVISGRAERVEVPDRPWEPPPLRLELTADERRADIVLGLEGAVVRRGDWALGPLDMRLSPGDRVAVTGPNGAGKSTLLGALAGRLPLAAGARRAAPGLVVGVLGQDREALAADGSLSAAVRALTGLDETGARTALAAFGLGAGVADRPAATLSAGERTRAELAVLGRRRVTCLLLDEPTNHLDADSLEVLEGALARWPGTLVVATHDRRLAAALAPGRELAL
jgi:ATPase subunit of ABC transporter with duplicated ATPase domains